MYLTETEMTVQSMHAAVPKPGQGLLAPHGALSS